MGRQCPAIVVQWRALMVRGMAAIQRADRRSRTFAILGLAAAGLAGAMLLVQFESWLTEVRGLPVEAAYESLTWGFSWCIGMGSVLLTAAGCYMWWWGTRVRRALRFPPPGATVIRDTIVLEGQAAASRGMLLQLLGATFLLCAVGLAVGSWWILRMLGADHS